MIQYLINVTAIWVISLLAFDLLLKRDKNYSYSRGYLIATLLLGLLLPLVRMPVQRVVNAQVLQAPMRQVQEVKQVMVDVAAPATGYVSLALVCLFIYLTGVAVGLLLLLREGWMLAKWYRQGEKVKQGGYTMVVTGKEHSPFSVMGLIFISSVEAYDDEQMTFILSHEQQHIRRKHSWDKFFVLLLRTVFWVHPLVYIYYKRLMMVHEFEADAAAGDTMEYGAFLITQHMTDRSPFITHSFNHSPLKTRIRMLTTKQSRPWRKAAYAITLPIVAAFGLLWVNSTSAHKKEQKGNIITFNGNTIEMGMPLHDGVPASPEPLRLVMGGGSEGDKKVKDDRISASPVAVPETKDAEEGEVIMVSLSPIPLKLNGEPIYDEQDLKQKLQLRGAKRSVFAEVVEKAAPVLSQLGDGKYMMSVADLVVDKAGHVAYYNLGEIKWYTSPTPTAGTEKETMAIINAKDRERAAHPVDEAMKQRIAEAVADVLDGLSFVPAKKDKQAVNTFTNEMYMQNQYIVVKNGKVSVAKGDMF